MHGTLAIQTVVLTDRLYYPFQLLIQSLFPPLHNLRCPYPSPTGYGTNSTGVDSNF
jgi:hypothetical protein